MADFQKSAPSSTSSPHEESSSTENKTCNVTPTPPSEAPAATPAPDSDSGSGAFCRVYPDGFTIRRMTRADAQTVIGWYNGICATSDDLEVAFDAFGDELQAFVGVLDNRVIASKVQTPAAPDVLYGSLLYVEERLRGGGYGRRINFDVALESVGGRVVCIDAHAELRPVNAKRGYVDGFEVVHYTGRAATRQAGQAPGFRKTWTVVPFTHELFQELLRYDDKCYVRASSPHRRRLLERWTALPGGRTLLALASGEEEGGPREVVGYGCRRSTRREGNFIVGPLYAESYDVALDLVTELTSDVVGGTIWMTVCVPNQDAVCLVRELGLEEDIHMCRMYRNGVLDPPNSRVFAITSIDICGF